MKLANRTKVAFKVLMICARDPSRPVELRNAAESAGATKVVVQRVATRLMRHGFVRIMRGYHGGVRICRPAHTITLGEVARAMEPSLEQDLMAAETGSRELDNIVLRALAAYIQLFDTATIADLISSRQS
jgi:Rrf2 family protein